jgi:hypothetical protein
MRFVDIRNDIAFRKIFGNEKKTISLISFLNAGLKEAYVDAEKHKWSKKELIAYDNAFMRLQDSIGELSHAKKEGIQEGENSKEAEAVIGFYDIGVAPENIAKALKITLEKVLEIIAKH